MIKINEFRRIDIEVKNAIRQVFDFAKQHEKDKNDYYLFLCNAMYNSKYEGSSNPYVIDSRIDALIDAHRREFLTKYLNTNYSFSQFNTSDSKESLTLEMMMYTHIWESKTFLKQLKKLLNLCMGTEYDWKFELEGYSKEKFIRENLRDNFKKLNLGIADIITNGYRSQFRNAFAHSDYSFGLNDYRINLHNYKPNRDTIEHISFDEWSIFFCSSFLMNYHFIKHYYDEKQKMDLEVSVLLRNKYGNKKQGLIFYDKANDSFSGKLIEK